MRPGKPLISRPAGRAADARAARQSGLGDGLRDRCSCCPRSCACRACPRAPAPVVRGRAGRAARRQRPPRRPSARHAGAAMPGHAGGDPLRRVRIRPMLRLLAPGRCADPAPAAGAGAAGGRRVPIIRLDHAGPVATDVAQGLAWGVSDPSDRTAPGLEKLRKVLFLFFFWVRCDWPAFGGLTRSGNLYRTFPGCRFVPFRAGAWRPVVRQLILGSVPHADAQAARAADLHRQPPEIHRLLAKLRGNEGGAAAEIEVGHPPADLGAGGARLPAPPPPPGAGAGSGAPARRR